MTRKFMPQPAQRLVVLPRVDFGWIGLLGLAPFLILFVTREMVGLGVTQLTDVVAPLCDQSSAALLPASAFLGPLRDQRAGNRPRCADDRATQSRAAADERDCDLGCHNGQSGMVVNVLRDARRYGRPAPSSGDRRATAQGNPPAKTLENVGSCGGAAEGLINGGQ